MSKCGKLIVAVFALSSLIFTSQAFAQAFDVQPRNLQYREEEASGMKPDPLIQPFATKESGPLVPKDPFEIAREDRSLGYYEPTYPYSGETYQRDQSYRTDRGQYDYGTDMDRDTGTSVRPYREDYEANQDFNNRMDQNYQMDRGEIRTYRSGPNLVSPFSFRDSGPSRIESGYY
ncbi:MAG TPA: hypothetical protein PKE52_15940 [Bacteroidales bacterium]|jgi:hypothetical protein|nr:hypothetical protein [Bacteroidales bacterium]